MWRFLKELKVELPFDPAIPLLVIYPEENKPLFEKDTCTHMFIIHNNKTVESTLMPINQQMDKETLDICRMEYYSAIKRNKLTAVAMTWMRLETIFLSEVTQEWKTKHHTFSLKSGS